MSAKKRQKGKKARTKLLFQVGLVLDSLKDYNYDDEEEEVEDNDNNENDDVVSGWVGAG